MDPLLASLFLLFKVVVEVSRFVPTVIIQVVLHVVSADTLQLGRACKLHFDLIRLQVLIFHFNSLFVRNVDYFRRWLPPLLADGRQLLQILCAFFAAVTLLSIHVPDLFQLCLFEAWLLHQVLHFLHCRFAVIVLIVEALLSSLEL